MVAQLQKQDYTQWQSLSISYCQITKLLVGIINARADILRDARIQAGLSQQQVAEKLNISRQSTSKWENNLSYPDVERIGQLCELYSLSAAELLGIAPDEAGLNFDDNRNTDDIQTRNIVLLIISVIIPFLGFILALKYLASAFRRERTSKVNLLIYWSVLVINLFLSIILIADTLTILTSIRTHIQ